MIDLVRQHHIPDLDDHIAIKIVGSPTTSEDFCCAPFGNAYGSAMLAKDTTSRLSAKTPFPNLYWCNASSGIPSIFGTVSTGSNLYMDLTGDEFFDPLTAPTDEEFIAALSVPLPQ
jgi:all-trans-retinol 13,14-reductase